MKKMEFDPIYSKFFRRFISLFILLWLTSLACNIPGIGTEDIAPQPSPITSPTQAAEPELIETPPNQVILPAALLVELNHGNTVQMLDPLGGLVASLDLVSLGEYIMPFSIGGNTPDGITMPPLILRDSWDGTLQYYAEGNLHPMRWEQATQPVMAPGSPYMAISKTTYFENDIRSELYVGSAAELVNAAPVYSLESSAGDDEWLVITPLSVQMDTGQPVGVWYTLALTGLGGDIVYPVRHSLWYFDLATREAREIIGRAYSPNSVSPDNTWVVYTEFEGTEALLRTRNLQSGEEFSLPLDPASNRGAGFARISPDNSKVAWMEADGSWMGVEPNFSARLKLARLNGEILYDFDGQMMAEKIGANYIHRIEPVLWLDDISLIVQVSGGGDDSEKVGLLKVNTAAGTIDLFSYSAFMSPVYLGQNLAPVAVSQPEFLNAIPDQSLLRTGPWVALPSQQRLWAANLDGSGLMPLINQASLSWYVQQVAAAPQGGYLAFTAAWDNDNLAGMTLFLADLPDATVETLTELSWEGTTPPQSPQVCDPNFEAARAITMDNALAWSPDGRKLAFIGAHLGTTADVYIYSVDTGEITQITDGPSQAYGLSWSPDSQYVVHFGASCFGTGAGFSMMGAWAAKYDDTDVITLYEVDPQSAGERVVGWLGNREVVVETMSGCPAKNLRKVNLDSGAVTVLYEGCYYDAAMAEDGTIGLVNADDIGTAGAGGVYIFPASGGQRIHNPDLQGYDITYSPGFEAFLIQDTDFLVRSVDFSGQPGFMMTQLEIPVFSQSGSWWALPLFETLEVGGEAGPDQVIFNGMVPHLVWTQHPQSGQETLLFLGGSGYDAMQWYAAYPPDFEPLPASSANLSAGSAEPVIVYP